jgi:hypothetical protein
MIIRWAETPAPDKCEYCRGQDGEEKDIYATRRAAGEMARRFEQEHDILLAVYPCPRGNGFHLTRDRDTPQDIPRKSTGALSWEYVGPEAASGMGRDTPPVKPPLSKKQDRPIRKVAGGNTTREREITGTVMEIIENIDVEKLFQINRDNVFALHFLQPYLTGGITQITLYSKQGASGPGERGQDGKPAIQSYTALLPTAGIPKKLRKGQQLTLRAIGKTINQVNRWVCTKIVRQSGAKRRCADGNGKSVP